MYIIVGRSIEYRLKYNWKKKDRRKTQITKSKNIKGFDVNIYRYTKWNKQKKLCFLLKYGKENLYLHLCSFDCISILKNVEKNYQKSVVIR